MDSMDSHGSIGCGSKPMRSSHFGGFRWTTHFRTYFSGDWDVHWRYDLDFDPPHVAEHLVACSYLPFQGVHSDFDPWPIVNARIRARPGQCRLGRSSAGGEPSGARRVVFPWDFTS